MYLTLAVWFILIGNPSALPRFRMRHHSVPDEATRIDWRALPLHARSLAGTAPALVMTVANDPLCDEGRAYGERLERDGVAVTALHVSDQPHGVLTMGGILPPAQLCVGMIGAALRNALSS